VEHKTDWEKSTKEAKVRTGLWCHVIIIIIIIIVKHFHYRPMGPRLFWEVKASRLRDIGT
jgi:hypothetical protein